MSEVELYLYRLEERHGNGTATHTQEEQGDGVNNGSSQPLYVINTPHYRLDNRADARLPQRSKLKDPE